MNKWWSPNDARWCCFGKKKVVTDKKDMWKKLLFIIIIIIYYYATIIEIKATRIFFTFQNIFWHPLFSFPCKEKNPYCMVMCSKN